VRREPRLWAGGRSLTPEAEPVTACTLLLRADDADEAAGEGGGLAGPKRPTSRAASSVGIAAAAALQYAAARGTRPGVRDATAGGERCATRCVAAAATAIGLGGTRLRGVVAAAGTAVGSGGLVPLAAEPAPAGPTVAIGGGRRAWSGLAAPDGFTALRTAGAHPGKAPSEGCVEVADDGAVWACVGGFC